MAQSDKYYKSCIVGVTSEVGLITDRNLSELSISLSVCLRNTISFITLWYRKSRGMSHFTTTCFTYEGESKVLQYFCNMRHNSTVPNVLAEVMKGTNYTGLWDAKLVWYSPKLPQWLRAWPSNLWFKFTSTCWIIEVLATEAKFLEPSGYGTEIKCAFIFHSTNASLAPALPCRIHQLQWVSWYDTKQSDGEVPVMLGLWRMQSTPSLLLLPGPLWPSVVAPDRALSMG